MKLYKVYYTGKLEDIFHTFEVDKHGELIDKEIPTIKGKYPLYGFTVEKKLMKKFLNQRNRDRFILKSKEIDSDDYSMYLNRYRNQSLKLEKLLTRTDDKEIKYIPMVITEYENLEINDFDIEFILQDLSPIPVVNSRKYFNVFHKPYQKILKMLCFNVYLGLEAPDSKFDIDDDFSRIDGYDEINLLLKTFRGTFI